MRVIIALSFLVSATAAFSQNQNRRDAFASVAAAAGAALAPQVANAAEGESPRFSIFGLFGDGSAYSEGAAYGTDQSVETYSPYSVYSEPSKDTLYDKDSPEYIARKKAVLLESKKRLEKMPAYVEKKQWFEVTNELNRFMYVTRDAVDYLISNVDQEEAGKAFEESLNTIFLAAKYRQQDACAKAIPASIAKLDAFEKLL